MRMAQVVISGAVRTPIGNLNGGLSNVSATTLGGHVIRESLVRSHIDPSRVDQVLMGNVLTAGVGPGPPPQAARAAGLPDEVPATTVGKVCGSGLEAVILGCQAIQSGGADVVVAGGMESMSQAPYLLSKREAPHKAEWKVGDLTESMVCDGLWDASSKQHMGVCVEEMIAQYGFSRDALDDFSVRSYTRALESWRMGAFDAEIVEVVTSDGGKSSVVREDERPRRFHEQKLRKLPPAFLPLGTVTAGNATGTNDGASSLVLLSEDRARSLDVSPVAKILAYSRKGSAPQWFGLAQAIAIRDILSKLSLQIDDIDLFEINEAFAAVPMAIMAELGLESERVNVHGGAVALGHPIGASGVRILTTLIHALQRRGGRRGIASLCIGGGEGIALAVEML
ncbi:MAG: thiolase family protein [Nitrospirae bacterium]|nr:thiolase family protein [Nitrospirota bacterium]